MNNNEILKNARIKKKKGETLTLEEERVLLIADTNNKLQNEKRKNVTKKVRNGEPLTEEEHRLYQKMEINRRNRLEKEKLARENKRNGNILSDWEKNYIERQKKTYNERILTLKNIKEKNKNNIPLNSFEKKLLETENNNTKYQNEKRKNIIEKSKNGEYLTEEEKILLKKRKEYGKDRYLELKNAINKRNNNQLLSEREKIILQKYDDKLNKFYAKKRDVREKLKAGLPLTFEEEKFIFTIKMRQMIHDSFRRDKNMKNSSSFNIIGCNYEDAMRILIDSYKEVYGVEFDGDWSKVHIDHMIPLSDARSKMDFYYLNGIWNLQLLNVHDNESKNNIFSVVRNPNHPAWKVYNPRFELEEQSLIDLNNVEENFVDEVFLYDIDEFLDFDDKSIDYDLLYDFPDSEKIKHGRN